MSETVDGCHINHFVFSDNLKFDHEKIESAKLRGLRECVVDCVGAWVKIKLAWVKMKLAWVKMKFAWVKKDFKFEN